MQVIWSVTGQQGTQGMLEVLGEMCGGEAVLRVYSMKDTHYFKEDALYKAEAWM